MNRIKKISFVLSVIIFIFATFANAEMSVFQGETLYDSTNSLIWFSTPFKARNHSDATAFAAALDQYQSTSWRLATKTELLSIVDETYTPKIDPLFSLGSAKNWTSWSSTTKTDSSLVLSSRAYIVSYLNGSSIAVPIRSNYAFLITRDWDGFDYSLLDSAGKILIDSNGKYLLGAE
jgi:hypothetical protein